MSEPDTALDSIAIARLVDDIRDGRPEAGAFLVSLLGAQLLGYAALVAPDLGEADREELCERVVERAVEKITAFDEARGTFRGWVRGILRNEVKEWRRRHPVSEPLDEASTSIPFDALGSDDTSENEISASALVQALLSRLSPTDALIIQLHDLEGLPFRAIAEQLNAREDACRQRHHRAMARLRLAATMFVESAEEDRG